MSLEPTTSMHLRLPSGVMDWMKAEATKQRRSVASFALVLIEDAREWMAAATPSAVTAKPLVRHPTVKRTHDADRVLAIVQDHMRTHAGANGVSLAMVKQAFFAGHTNPQAAQEAFRRSLLRLVGRGALAHDAKHIWLPSPA